MNRRDFLRRAAATGVLGAAAVASTPVAGAVTLGDIEGSVRCYCGCGKVLETCDCKYADNARAFIQEKVDAGLPKEEVIDAYVAQFTMWQGPSGLQDYPLRATVAKEGRGLSLWLIPPIGLVVGAAFVSYYLKRDVGEGGTASGMGAECPGCGTPVDPSSKFCTGCGEELGFSYCTSCGAEVVAGDSFCSACGESL